MACTYLTTQHLFIFVKKVIESLRTFELISVVYLRLSGGEDDCLTAIYLGKEARVILTNFDWLQESTSSISPKTINH